MSKELFKPFNIGDIDTILFKKYPYLTITNLTQLLRYAIVNEVMLSGDGFNFKPWFQDIVIENNGEFGILGEGRFKKAQNVFSKVTGDMEVKKVFFDLYINDMIRLDSTTKSKTSKPIYLLGDFYNDLEAKLEELEGIKEYYPEEYLNSYKSFLCPSRANVTKGIDEAPKLSEDLDIAEILEYIQNNPTELYVVGEHLWLLSKDNKFAYKLSVKSNPFYSNLTKTEKRQPGGNISSYEGNYTTTTTTTEEGPLSSILFTEANRNILQVTAYNLKDGSHSSSMPFKALMKIVSDSSLRSIENLNKFYIHLILSIGNLGIKGDSAVKGFGNSSSDSAQKVQLALRKEYY